MHTASPFPLAVTWLATQPDALTVADRVSDISFCTAGLGSRAHQCSLVGPAPRVCIHSQGPPAHGRHTPRQGVYRRTQLCGSCAMCGRLAASIEQCNVSKSVGAAQCSPSAWGVGSAGASAQGEPGLGDARMHHMRLTTGMAAAHNPASIQLQLQQSTLYMKTCQAKPQGNQPCWRRRFSRQGAQP